MASLSIVFLFGGGQLAAALRSTLHLDLTGPYDVLSGVLKGLDSERCVLHGRHFYDPPEVVTVLTEKAGSGIYKAGFHVGYFRLAV